MSTTDFLEKHKPGTYLAKPVDWGITKTRAGLPQVIVTFRYAAGDLNWYGSFKDNVVERTVDTLIAMGLKGTLETLADGAPGNALDKNREMEIVVEHKMDQNGEKRAGVAWVNDPTKTRIKTVTKAEATNLLSGVNAVLMQRKQQTAGSSTMTESDLPF